MNERKRARQTRLRFNDCLSKEDIEEMFLCLLEPLSVFYEKRPGRLKLGTHGTVYTEDRRQIEAYLRPLWGLGPFITNKPHPLTDIYLEGITKGVDPRSPDYWGEIDSSDQLIVEMASLSTSLLLNKENIWDRLEPQTQKNLHHWLMQVNESSLPRNNWHFFRVLINLAMKNCGRSYSKSLLEKDLETIESFYQGEGWYCDGVETQVDYYVSFAIHYYSLIYCRFMEKEDPVRAKRMKKRACLFAQTFKYWFDEEGRGLPFGRSLTYRFAQVSFFSALVFANVEALPWGEIKGLISRHLKYWNHQEMLTTDGLLSVGYHYQNMVFAEGYNGPGSPYWAFKTFLLLAVPDDHPYWQAEALGLKIEVRKKAVPSSKNMYQYDQTLKHVQAFPAGQFIQNQNHGSAKYSKFVYSTLFGFSVPKSNGSYGEGAYDSCLALSEDGRHFRTKELDEMFSIELDRVVHLWRPWSDVTIKSTIVPLENGHLRIHEIWSERLLYVYEGGFSVPMENTNRCIAGQCATARPIIGTSRIKNIIGYKKAGIIGPEPNTSLYFPVTLLPYLTGVAESGKQVFISVISGVLPEQVFEEPAVEIIGRNIEIGQLGQRINVKLEEKYNDGQ
ncbi:MAG: DUF2264 domain-containing protein [Enterococcus sp.]|nr:DUF2264 domain-containing protein [Enterococcus sp.]